MAKRYSFLLLQIVFITILYIDIFRHKILAGWVARQQPDLEFPRGQSPLEGTADWRQQTADRGQLTEDSWL